MKISKSCKQPLVQDALTEPQQTAQLILTQRLCIPDAPDCGIFVPLLVIHEPALHADHNLGAFAA